ncbi:metalloregulator ArsR/SmtB family transcription factor [Blastopirellula sp. J2-11]|uniref:ArsR/SmtB family transcription factor n=1 Tax=Blastopirellula sp. J2-11 TaxID=2943192 RepID=UPI0021C7FBC6|nr:metalloregulator ArsR/SmtB family transcription factor [Blastopirellula sp. J2-11]UUO08886.1 metalloregulator ArsR/SmtB family transcription factor [Blastopirellula sp. J2-11]
MPRAATTTDVFNAIAEPRRRQIIDLLAQSTRPQAVGDLVEALQLSQPTVSKHLAVLRKVGIVSVRKQGQHRLYELNAVELRPVHDWVKTYEQFWSGQLSRIKQRAEKLAAERAGKKKSSNSKEL